MDTSDDSKPQRKRKPTSTSDFGTGARQSHDASAFYSRFTPPNLSKDETVNPCTAAGTIAQGDSRQMSVVPDNSVALVVTSPPYFAGKAYENDLARDEIPEDYVSYLEMLRDVFSECLRVLEPGGRIAVNVANLGRKPFRSLASDVTSILQDDLRLLLRGEHVWVKSEAASGSVAWGSFCSPSNPVMRDLSERIIVASKGRFDRAVKRKKREERGMPFESDIAKDEFMEWTYDVWKVRPESARRIGHPAPFPIEIPHRLIKLHTYVGDTVLDPFLGSGSTAVAASRLGRGYVGFDLDPAYVALAAKRVEEEGGSGK